MKKKTKSKKKLQNLAETCTGLIATAGVSAEDDLVIVINMLRHHPSLVMDPESHDAFMDGFNALLRRTTATNSHDDATRKRRQQDGRFTIEEYGQLQFESVYIEGR